MAAPLRAGMIGSAMPEMSKVSFSLHNALTRWQWSPFSLFVAAALVGVAFWYLRADWQLAARGRRWPGGRTASFFLGLVAIDLALEGPVATFTGSYFQAHVIQHLLLMVVAPPFLALGAPSTLLLQSSSRNTKVRWLRVLRSGSFAVLTCPITVWVLYFGVMFIFFLTPLINVAMHDMALMDLFNVTFLLGGCLYWWPMVGVDPIIHWKMGYGARMLNVLIGAAPETLIGLAILSSRSPIASMYTLASTHAGGGLLWTSTEFATFVGFVPIFIQWMRADARMAARDDARLDRSAQELGSPVDHAIDAASAGHDPSAWEAAWMAKTGSVPPQRAADA